MSTDTVQNIIVKMLFVVTSWQFSCILLDGRASVGQT